MKAQRVWAGIAFLCLLLFSNPYWAKIIFCNLNNGLGPNFTFDNSTGLFTLDASGGELRLIKNVVDQTYGFKHGIIKGIFSLSGNFDLNIDYTIYRVFDNK